MSVPRSTLDVSDGGDLDANIVGGGRRLLSVAEIQQALRELQAQPRPAAAGIGALSPPPENGDSQRPALKSEQGPATRRPRTKPPRTPAQGSGDTEREELAWGDRAAGTRQGRGDIAELRAGWTTVLAAHAGAGASTVALAIGDAAAADDRRVHLVDSAHPSRSGLVAAASEELGSDVTGAWRRGLRTGVTIDRRAADLAPGGWPVPPVGEGPALTVIDLGLAASEMVRLAADRTCLVVVCRPTVPGVRLTEQLLDLLARQPAAIAAVGPSKWPGEVTASLGPRLRALRADGRVVPLPMDRRLQVTGPTSSPLPKSVRSAGRQLLELVDGSHLGAP